jgi:hypothetical protein
MDNANPDPALRGALRLWFKLPDESGLDEEERRARHRWRLEILIYVCWCLIVVKSLVVVWAINHYSVPIHPLWVIGPTVGFAFLATAVYYWLRD